MLARLDFGEQGFLEKERTWHITVDGVEELSTDNDVDTGPY